MNKITLSVNDENLDILLSILNNLKSGLITEMQINTKAQVKQTQYQPKNKGVIYEHESGTNDSSGKYSASAYKKRLKSRQ